MLAAGSGRLVSIYGNLGDRQQGYVSAFAVAKAGIARLTKSLACELAGTEVRVLGVHPGLVRMVMTEQLAWGEQGRAWLPGFGETAQRRWADAQPAADLIASIALGAADQLTGRILNPRDDLSALTGQCQSQPGRMRPSCMAFISAVLVQSHLSSNLAFYHRVGVRSAAELWLAGLWAATG